MADLHSSDTLANVRKAFPVGPKTDAGRPLPIDDYGDAPVVIMVKCLGAIGYATPYALTRRTVRGRKFYEAEWLDTANRARFIRARDAADFLDLHRYAEGVRRITGELPAWASEQQAP